VITPRLSVSIKRRWYVPLIGLAATALTMLGVLNHPGVYHAQVEVIFLAPDRAVDINTFEYVTDSLIDTAGFVGRSMSGTAAGGSAPVSDAVTLVSEGVEEGYSVRLPNVGGQWAYNFTRPVLDIQVAGSSASEVSAKLDELVRRVNSVLRARELSQGPVDPDNMIRTRLNPPDPGVVYSAGSHLRALAATGLLGGGLTLAATRSLDVYLLRRARKRTPAPEAPVTSVNLPMTATSEQQYA
jgi:hypothetical protein